MSQASRRVASTLRADQGFPKSKVEVALGVGQVHAARTLRSSDLCDLAAMREVASPSILEDIQSLREDHASLRKPQVEKKSDDASDVDDEYEFEAALRKDAKPELRGIWVHNLQQAQLAAKASAGDPGCGIGSDGETVDHVADPRPACQKFDWQSMDRFIVPHPTSLRYKNILDDAGCVVGQFQVILGDGPYRAAVVCLCGNHKERCSRSRGWRSDGSEMPQHVDRVLARWVRDASKHTSTRSHMSAPRL